MLRFLITGFLVIHGLIVSAQSAGSFNPASAVQNPAWLSWWPAALGHSWLLSWLGLEKPPFSWLSGLLWLAGGLLLIAAGLGVVGVLIPQGLWRPLAISGAVVSLLMLLVYLHPFLGIGILADAAILVALLWAQWPAVSAIGS